jgi:hypothetical protein
LRYHGYYNKYVIYWENQFLGMHEDLTGFENL